MKKIINRKSIVIFLVIALLMGLSCAFGDEASPTDLKPVEDQTVQDIVQDVTNNLKITEKTIFRMTYKSDAEPTVEGIGDENLAAQIRTVMEAHANTVFQQQLTEGKTIGVEHNLKKITRDAKIEIINTDPVHELTAVYTQDQRAESVAGSFEVQGEQIIDHMVITIKDPPPVEDTPPANNDTGVTDQNANPAPDPQPQQQSTEPATGDKTNPNRMTDTREVYVVSESGSSSNSTPTETERDPNLAPDGSVYVQDTGDTDKSGLVAVSGGAQGPSFNITDPVKVDNSKYALTTPRASSTSSSAYRASSGPAGATATTDTDDDKEGTDGDEETDETDGTDWTAAYDRIYSVAGGYNVVLVGVSENYTEGETWPLILQRGIVYEDFAQEESAAEDTDGLLQTGMEGIRKEEDPGYWDAPSAGSNAEDMIIQFGFYKFAESEKKETDMETLIDAATRLAGEGLTMNARGIPFFMEVQLKGSNEEIDILRQLITELEVNGYGGNTVLIFAQTGNGAEKKPLVMIHPAISEGMTVKTPMKTEDVLATILSLSGQATAKQMEVLNTLPGQNLLTAEELQGITGLVPEPKAEEEMTAEETETEKAGAEGDASGIPKFQRPEGFGKNGMPDGSEQQKNRMNIDRTQVTMNSNGQGAGSDRAAPGSEVQKSGEPGGSGDAEVNSEGPGGSGNADDSNSAGPGGAGTGEVSSDGPGHP